MKQIRSLPNHPSIAQNYNRSSSAINSVQSRQVYFNLQQPDSSFITQPQLSIVPKKSVHNQVQQGYIKTLEQTVCDETFSNVENIINQNLRTIQALNDQNQRLYRHLDNLKSLFAVKFNLNYQTEKNRTTITIIPSNQQSNLDSKAETFDKKTQKLQKQGTKRQAIRKAQVKVKTQHRDNVQRILSEQNKGTMNYQNEGWKTEHSFVMFFLTNELKSKVRPTQDITKTIDKRALRKKYLSWKEENGFENTEELPQYKIGQILTNQIKALFHCTCSSKEYLGLQFINADENILSYEEEVFLEGQSSK